mgnify:CR=1 FL=1
MHRIFWVEFLQEAQVCPNCSGVLTKREARFQLCPCGFQVDLLSRDNHRYATGVCQRFFRIVTVVQNVIELIRGVHCIYCISPRFLTT